DRQRSWRESSLQRPSTKEVKVILSGKIGHFLAAYDPRRTHVRLDFHFPGGYRIYRRALSAELRRRDRLRARAPLRLCPPLRRRQARLLVGAALKMRATPIDIVVPVYNAAT